MADNIEIRGTTLFISTTSDYHKAFLMMKPPVTGHTTVTLKEIIDALASKGVRYEIDEMAIEQMIVNENFNNQICVSSWRPPVDGKNGSIKYRFPSEINLVPQIDENGTVDYKNMGYVRFVKKGTVIADITLPVPGECGYDVRGVPVRQYMGKAAAFSVGENVEVSEDGLTLVATEDGHLEFRSGCFNVFTTVTVNQNVDASTGNITFSGDIVIKGDIDEGFKVSSTHNITVTGCANGAELEAGGDIEVRNGLMNAKVTAHGSVKSKFCEYTKITADGDVVSPVFVVCTVYAGGTLTASKTLSGGKYTCIGGGTVGSVGTKTYAKTEVSVGDNSMLSEEKTELLKTLEELDRQVLQCTQIVEFLNAKKKELKKIPPEREEQRGKAIKTKYTLLSEKKRMQERIDEIDERLAVKQFLKFDCRGEAFPGTKVIISGVSYTVNDEMRRVSFHLNDAGEVEAFPL